MAANHFDDLRVLAEKFTEGRWPDMLCPTCTKGALTPVDTRPMEQVESAESFEAHDDENWDPGWINGTFHGELRCNRRGCGDSVLVVGTYSCVEGDDDENGQWTFVTAYRPLYFPPCR